MPRLERLRLLVLVEQIGTRQLAERFCFLPCDIQLIDFDEQSDASVPELQGVTRVLERSVRFESLPVIS